MSCSSLLRACMVSCRRKFQWQLAVLWLAVMIAGVARAQTFVIEPDNYTNAAVLDYISSAVHLTTAGADNLPIPPVSFAVTASVDNMGFASTGTNVFGHAGVPFWNSDRRLRMEFTAPVSAVTIDFVGGEYFYTEIGRLDGYNAAGQLVASFITAPLPADALQTMSITRPTADIALAIAYIAPDEGSFGVLDNLRFSVGQVSRPVLALTKSNGAPSLTFTGDAGQSYRVWASTNLVQWSVIGNPSPVQPGKFVFTDNTASNSPARYYRVSTP